MSIFGGLGSAIESAFTPSGTNARNAQQDQQRASAEKLYQLLSALGGNAQALAGQYNADEAAQRQALMALFSRLTAMGDPKALGGQYAAGAQRAVQGSNKRQADAARGAGFDKGFVAALAGGDPLVDARAQAGAQAQGRKDSIGYQAQGVDLLNQLLGQTQNRVGLLQALNSGVQNQQPVQVGQSPLGFLGQAAGMWAGGGFGGLGGGSTQRVSGRVY